MSRKVGAVFFVVVRVGGTIALAYETTCLCDSSKEHVNVFLYGLLP